MTRHDDLDRLIHRLGQDDGSVEVGEQPTEGPEEGGRAEARRRGVYLTPRQTFILIASVLAVILLALLLYLLWLSMPADFTKEGGDAEAGIVPELTIYGPGVGDKPEFAKPMGAAWNRSGNRIYVADTQNNRVVVFNDRGRYVSQFGGFGIAKPLQGAKRTWDPGELNYPTDVAVDENDDVFVADFYNDSISVFDSKGEFLRRFPDPNKMVGKGSSGQEGGGIAVTAVAVQDGKVYATDEFQVFVFDTDGKLLRQFGKPGQARGDLDRPGGISVDSRGRIYVSDSNHNRVTAFSPQGEVLWVTGEPLSDLRKKTDNPFVLPRGMTILRDGSILVADPLGQQLVKVDELGAVIAEYGARGVSEGEVNFPNDVSSRNDRILIADRENNRVQVVRLTGR